MVTCSNSSMVIFGTNTKAYSKNDDLSRLNAEKVLFVVLIPDSVKVTLLVTFCLIRDGLKIST